jgi:hypothetical protein
VVQPSVLAWNGGAVSKLAGAVYGDRQFADMPVVADALEEAGLRTPPSSGTAEAAALTPAAALSSTRSWGSEARSARKGEAMRPPKWLQELVGEVCDACVSDVKGRMSGFSYRWSEPDENSWGTWLLQVAPSVIEIAGGKDDGATGFDFVDADLLALPKCLDEVESFAYDPDYGERPRLTLVGTKGKHEVVVEVYFEPFDDDEPQTVFDVNLGGWREKGTEEE